MLNDVMRKALPGTVALLVVACQAAGPPTPGGLRPQPAELLAPARVPVLEPGSSFVFRRGDGEEIVSRVVAVDGEDVTWEADDGWTWTGKAPFWPVERWQGESSEGSQEIRGDVSALYPLAIGEAAAYRYSGRSTQQPAGWSGAGRCSVAAAERITVPAGTFDTFKIVCEQGEDLSDPYRVRTWWYAPAIGHHVATLHRTRDGAIDQLEQLVRYEAG
jgi:hypothetical protein